MLLIVADGVSGAPNDWLASFHAVELIKEALDLSNSPPSDAFSFAIKHSNEMIFQGIDGSIGMLTTLSAVLFFPEKNRLWYFNIGDSRIYGF